MKNRRIIIVALLVALLQVCNLSLAQEAEPNYLRFYHLSYFNSDFFIKAYDTGTCVFEFSNGKMMKSKNHTEPNGNMMIFVQLPTEEDSIIATILFNNEELGYFVSFLKRTKANYTKWLDKDTKGKERKMSRDVDYSSEMMMVNWYNPTYYTNLVNSPLGQALQECYHLDNAAWHTDVWFQNHVTYRRQWLQNRFAWLDANIMAMHVPNDVNIDGVVNISDVTALIGMVMGNGGPVMITGDINGDEDVNITDVTELINLLMSSI